MQENTTSTDQCEFVETVADLDGILDKHEERDVVHVNEDANDYIVLKNRDGEKFWHPMNGASVDECVLSNNWFIKGCELFDKKPLDQESLRLLREVLLAISVLTTYFQYDMPTVERMLDQLIVKFSYEQYCKDYNFKDPVEALKDNSDFMAYINRTALLVKTYGDLVNETRESFKQSKKETPPSDK